MCRTRLLSAVAAVLLCSSSPAVERFPQDKWMQYASPEDAGFSAQKLEQAKQYWKSLQSAAFMVVRDGAVVVAWGDLDRRFLLHSGRKSIMSGLYGIHADAGSIDLNKNLQQLAIDDIKPRLTVQEKRAKIIDLLRARSGVYHPAAAEDMQMTKPPRGSHKPGTHWCYNNWDFNALCTILEQECDLKVFEEFKKRFAGPLQMQDYRIRDGFYMYEKNSSVHPAYHLRMSARDMARYGLLYLANGSWNGQQILSEEWVRESTRSHSDDAWGDGYGYMWWVSFARPFKRLKMFSARGVGEQSIDVLPVANMVCVLRTNTYERNEVSEEQKLRLIRMILDARTSETKENPKLVPLPSVPRTWAPIQLPLADLKKLCDGGSNDAVRMENGVLIARTPRGDRAIIPIDGGKYIIEDSYEEAVLEKNADGSVTSVVTESGLNDQGYELFLGGSTAQAVKVFRRSVEYFPESANAYDSLGEALAAQGELELAISSYERTLQLAPGAAHATNALELLKLRLHPIDIGKTKMRSYAGKYGRTEVLHKHGVLFIKPHGEEPRELIPMSEDQFRQVQAAYPRFHFVQDSNGVIVAMNVLLENGRSVRRTRGR